MPHKRAASSANREANSEPRAATGQEKQTNHRRATPKLWRSSHARQEQQPEPDSVGAVSQYESSSRRLRGAHSTGQAYIDTIYIY